MLVRVRGPEGQTTLKLDPDATIVDFWARLEQATGVPVAAQEILSGFPPRPLAYPVDLSDPVSSLGIQPGDSLTVARLPGAAPAPAVAAAPEPAAAGPAWKRQRREGGGSVASLESSRAYAPQHSHDWLMLPPGPPTGREEHLARFLRDYPPWGASLPHDLAWIAIKGRQGVGAAAGGGAAAPLVGPYEDPVEVALALWASKAAAERTAEAAQQIGKGCGILSGKWLVRASPEDEEVVWGAIAHAVYVEGLCALAKISAGPQGGGPHQVAGQRVICVYTDDFSDREDAMHVHAGLSAALRAAQPQRAKWPVVSYKPDIFTHLNIYWGNGNASKIKPTIYSKKL